MKTQQFMWYFLIGSGIALTLWGVGNLLTYGLQKFFIFQPNQLPQDYQFSFSANFEEVFLTAEDGAQINALHFISSHSPSKGVILYCHGNAGDLARWGVIHDDFLPFGYDLFIYDYRGYGKSTGEMTEDKIHRDATMVYDHLRKQYQPGEIVIYGRSLGSAMATHLASEVECHSLILETPFSSMKDLFYTYYPFLPNVFFFRYSFDNAEYIKNVDETIMIFQGTNDWTVPLSCAQQLQPHLKPEDEFVIIEGANHNNICEFETYWQKLEQVMGSHPEKVDKQMQKGNSKEKQGE